MVDSNVVKIKTTQASEPQAEVDPFLNQEYGVERALPFSAWGSTEGEIARDSRISLDDMVLMRRRDGQARALMRLFMLPMISAFMEGKWIMPDEESDEEDGAEEVDFANQMWDLPPQAGGMTSSKLSVFKKTLMGTVDGFAAFEEVRHIPKEGPLAGLITLRKLAYRDPRTVIFKVDDSGGFNGFRQIVSTNNTSVDVVIPKEKAFFWACNAEENPYYGVSMFEAAYEHYQIKRKLYYIAHLASQFAAVPGRIGTVPKNADPRHVAAFKQALANFAFNTSMVAPPEYAVTAFNSNSQFNFLNLIDHHNHMMSKSVLGQFVDSEQRSALIEVGRVDPNTDFFVMALESLMDDIAEHWSTYLMPKYIDWNFGTKRYPVFKFGAFSDQSRDTIANIFQTIVTSSTLNSTPEFVREVEKRLAASLDLGINYDKIEEQEKKIAEEQIAAAAAEAEQLQGGALPGTPSGEDSGSSAGPSLGGSPTPQGGGVDFPDAVSLSNPSVDDLVAVAQRLFEERPPGDADSDDVFEESPLGDTDPGAES